MTALKIPVVPSKQSGIHGRLFTERREEAQEGRAKGWGILEISQSGVKTCRELGEVPHLWKMGQDHPWIYQRGAPRLSFVFPYTTSPGMGKAWALCPIPCLSQ